MASSYPPGWVARVERAPKLVLDVTSSTYRAPNQNIEVRAQAVDARTTAYLKAETARRKKRLSADDQALCRKYILLVVNWESGAWAVQAVPTPISSPTRRAPRAATAPVVAAKASA